MQKSIPTGIVLAALLAGSAMAADLPVRAPVYKAPPPVAVFSWTGFYVGGNIGYSWGNARTDIAGNGSIATFPGLSHAPPFDAFPGFPSSYAFADANTARLSGIIGGAQVGYNYQFNPRWVLGFEADIQGSGERGSGTFVDPFSTQIVTGFLATPPLVVTPTSSGPLQGTSVTAYEARIGWFGTVRGRLGFLITDQVLVYGTGGLAYGRVSVSGNTIFTETSTGLNNSAPPFALPPGGTQFNASKTGVGFAVGGGIEGKSFWLPAGWTWKLEYLYVDLGSLDVVTPYAIPATFFPTNPLFTISAQAGAIITHTRFTDNIVRVGLNYKFNNYYAPLATK
jgi:outer membrane immunogenic protein